MFSLTFHESTVSIDPCSQSDSTGCCDAFICNLPNSHFKACATAIATIETQERERGEKISSLIKNIYEYGICSALTSTFVCSFFNSSVLF